MKARKGAAVERQGNQMDGEVKVHPKIATVTLHLLVEAVWEWLTMQTPSSGALGSLTNWLQDFLSLVELGTFSHSSCSQLLLCLFCLCFSEIPFDLENEK